MFAMYFFVWGGDIIVPIINIPFRENRQNQSCVLKLRRRLRIYKEKTKDIGEEEKEKEEEEADAEEVYYCHPSLWHRRWVNLSLGGGGGIMLATITLGMMSVMVTSQGPQTGDNLRLTCSSQSNQSMTNRRLRLQRQLPRVS